MLHYTHLFYVKLDFISMGVYYKTTTKKQDEIRPRRLPAETDVNQIRNENSKSEIKENIQFGSWINKIEMKK